MNMNLDYDNNSFSGPVTNAIRKKSRDVSVKSTVTVASIHCSFFI